MSERHQVAIVDYGLGNLYSVKQACGHAGLRSVITDSTSEILTADAVILPGVGAFGDAMQTLQARDLVSVIRDVAQSPRLLIGVCLGMQLLMTESEEFGAHHGLGILDGHVARLPELSEGGRRLKIPHVGWTELHATGRRADAGGDPWDETMFAGAPKHPSMYFVHSFVVQPVDPSVVLSTSYFGDTAFCSSLTRGNITACQCHPERSGPEGLRFYDNLAISIQKTGERS